MSASSSQADLLESIPFVRDITPLDLLDLPTNLVFGSLPKPHNLKRSAGGPIWPPVLTNVLVNGLLILHHKPHLVGKQGLEEHYNWLSAFIYRQTRGWDQSALARNVVEIRSAGPGERVVGVIRNRKQISSKVQTIGEYLKDTHWAYVTQGPRSLKEAPSIGPVAGISAPATEMPTRPVPRESSGQSPGIPDISHVPLQLGWSPPAPFSLPITPRQSPFLYPADVPDYEFVDARLLGYDRGEWPEFDEHMAHYRRAQLPLMLDNYVIGKTTSRSHFDGSLLLTSITMAVHFSTHPPHPADGSPVLRKHQLAHLSQHNDELMQTVYLRNLDAKAQTLVQAINPSNRVYHVDLPICLPIGDHSFSLQDVQPGHHVKCNIGLHAGNAMAPYDDELKAISEVYRVADQGAGAQTLERLEGYQDVSLIKRQPGYHGGLFAPGPATAFMGKLWKDATGQSGGTSTDLNRYAIVQTIFSRSHIDAGKPLLTIVYTPRQVSFPQEATARLLVGHENTVGDSDHIETDYEGANVDDAPEGAHHPALRGPSATLRRSRRSSSTTGAKGQHGRGTSHASLHAPVFPVDTAGPVRNTRSHSRTRNSILTHRPGTASSPLSVGAKLPLTPRASPLISMRPSRRNSTTPSLLPVTPSYKFTEPHHHPDYATYGLITSPTGIFDAGHDEWSSLVGAPSSFSANMEGTPTYGVPSGSVWSYPRAGVGELGQLPGYPRPMQGADLTQPLYPGGDHITDRLHFYHSGASWA